MPVITFCPMCVKHGNYSWSKIKLCDDHRKKIDEHRILRTPFQDFFGYKDGSETSDSTWKTSFEKSVQLKLSKTFYEDNYKPFVPMKTFGDFKKRFEAEVPREVRKKMEKYLDESKEISIVMDQKSSDTQDIFDYLWDKVTDRVCELMSAISLEDPLDVVVHDIGENGGFDERSMSEDESFVCKGSGMRKRVIPDSDEDEPSKLTEAELQEQKEKRAKKRAAREAAEAAEAEQDAINDAQDQKHRDEVNAKQQKVASDITKSDEAIAKTLAMEPSDGIDEFLEDCMKASYEDFYETDDIKLLVRVANEEQSQTMRTWISMSEQTRSNAGVGTFEHLVRKLFSVPSFVEDQDIVRVVLAHVISSLDFDADKWKYVLCRYYDVPFLEGVDIMSNVEIMINFTYARKTEVYRWVIGTE